MAKVCKNILVLIFSTFFIIGCNGVDTFKKSAERGVASAIAFAEGILSIEEPPTSPTVPILHFRQILSNMETVTGLVASNSTRNHYIEKIDVFAFESEASSVTAPMWMAITELSNRMCVELVQKEDSLDMESRSFFQEIDFGADPGEISVNVREQVVRRMARAFWGRNETSQELNNMLLSIDEIMANDLNPRAGMIAGCTMMLASFPAQSTVL